jgi:hypothetical protein
MKTKAKRTRLREVLNSVLNVLEHHEGLSIKVEYRDDVLAIVAQDEGRVKESSPERFSPRGQDSDAHSGEVARSKSSLRSRSKRPKRIPPSGVPVPSDDKLVEYLRASPKNAGLEALAEHFNVRPRTLLRKALQKLVESGRLKRVGFDYRASLPERPHATEATEEAGAKRTGTSIPRPTADDEPVAKHTPWKQKKREHPSSTTAATSEPDSNST